MTTPLQKAAYEIGAKGSEPTEEDRLAFEAWMRGHCWTTVGDWDGRQYKHKDESNGCVHGGAMDTRRLWAAWRDRGALARIALDAELQQSVEPVAWIKLNDDGRTGALFHQNEGWKDASELVPLYLHPPQPQATTTTVPEGFALVPVEPTDEELAKGVRAMRLFVTKNSLIDFSLGYKVMLTAAQGEKP